MIFAALLSTVVALPAANSSEAITAADVEALAASTIANIQAVNDVNAEPAQVVQAIKENLGQIETVVAAINRGAAPEVGAFGGISGAQSFGGGAHGGGHGGKGGHWQVEKDETLNCEIGDED